MTTFSSTFNSEEFPPLGAKPSPASRTNKKGPDDHRDNKTKNVEIPSLPPSSSLPHLRVLVILNLNFHASDYHIRQFFRTFEIIDWMRLHNYITGIPLPTGFVLMNTRNEALRAIRELNGVFLMGRRVKLTMAGTEAPRVTMTGFTYNQATRPSQNDTANAKNRVESTAEAGAEAEAEAGTKAEVEAEAKVKAKVEAKVEAKAKAKVEVEAGAEAGAEAGKNVGNLKSPESQQHVQETSAPEAVTQHPEPSLALGRIPKSHPRPVRASFGVPLAARRPLPPFHPGPGVRSWNLAGHSDRDPAHNIVTQTQWYHFWSDQAKKWL